MTLTARNPRDPFVLTPYARPLQRGRGYDRLLNASALALALIGAVLVWAATRDLQRASGGDPQAYLYRHLVNLAIASALMFGASRFDARLLRLFGPIVYVASVLGLLLVFAVGSTINGAHAWIRLGGGFEIQPAEFMKLGMIVGMAVLFTQRAHERVMRRQFVAERVDETPHASDVLLAIGLVALPLVLILLQPDLGSAMVLAAAAFGVLVAAGVRARWTVGLLLLTVVVAIVVVKAGLLADYQLARFSAFTDPSHDPQGAAYNITQAHIAIANGGLFGTGLLHGPQTNGGFVPEQQTDFVFSVAGEEFGLLGGSVIIALFALLCWRGLKIAREADRAGRLVAVGIVCWFAFQAFQNIGMNLGLMPVTGLPLPFVSYGGSSMFAQGLAIGLLQAVRRASD
ncbi:MAG TPA: rod shape-determining protein RodA [Jatrophihabitantaceae bacterium]|jgi:rod shape determining protein RodA|nr:rod shape-determining protein RodA [Jatrophihabitantaceae bacterium]